MTTTAEHIAAIREALADPEIARFPDFTKAVYDVLAEIDRLKAENERMREALEPFAETFVCSTIQAKYFRAARAALKGGTHGN